MAGKSSASNEYTKQYYPEGALSRTHENRMNLGSRKAFEDAAARGYIMESTCLMCDCTTMQLSVDLPDGIRGIIPRSEACYVPGAADGGDTKDIAIITRVGKAIQFKVADMYTTDSGETVAVLSRRLAQRECYLNYISALIPGDIIPARVTHLEPFGAFCDIGCGIISLLTVDKISVSRISHPADRFRPGEYINAVVMSRDNSGRIYLSHRELLGTWEENAASFSPGQTVTGIIRSVEDYGIFVELSPNLAGLAELSDGAIPGACCSVYIKSIIPERMKIKLVLIDTCGTAEVTPCKYFIDTDTTSHIDSWRYSPLMCRKTVETEFEHIVSPIAELS